MGAVSLKYINICMNNENVLILPGFFLNCQLRIQNCKKNKQTRIHKCQAFLLSSFRIVKVLQVLVCLPLVTLARVQYRFLVHANHALKKVSICKQIYTFREKIHKDKRMRIYNIIKARVRNNSLCNYF